MGKPYSLNLRKHAVAAIEGGMSRHQAAKQFGVAISTAIGWMQRVEETGSVKPGQMGGHKPKAVSGDHAVWLSQRIRDSDFTIRGLVAELAGRGLKVDYHSVWDFVHVEKLSFNGRWKTMTLLAALRHDRIDPPWFIKGPIDGVSLRDSSHFACRHPLLSRRQHDERLVTPLARMAVRPPAIRPCGARSRWRGISCKRRGK